MRLPLFALALAAFAVGTTEFIIAGILPQVAGDLGVSIPTAGYLISGYAAGVAIGGPIVAIITAGFERKATLLGLMTLFIAGNVLCALSPTYGWLLAARVVISVTHGALIGFASVAATLLVTEERRGRAISLVLAGLTSANIAGVPLGTALGGAFGWRTAFWAIAALGVVSLAGMVALLPRMERRGETEPDLATEVRALGRQQVYTSLAMIVLASMAYFGLFSYIAPLLLNDAGVSAAALPVVLAVLGVASVAGILAGGRLADWKLMPSIIAIFAVQAAIYILLPLTLHTAITATVAMFIWNVTGISLVATPLQARVLKGARDAPNLASTLISSAFNVGISSGAALGAAALLHGVDYAQLPWLALAAIALALVLALGAFAWDRRTPATAKVA